MFNDSCWLTFFISQQIVNNIINTAYFFGLIDVGQNVA